MPYSITKDGDKHCVVKKSDGKKMGCHPSREAAMKQMAALHANEAMSNILWVDPFAYQPGNPFRIFPIGNFKRGDKTIELTSEKLMRMKDNYDQMRPRWRIPIYPGHPTEAQPDPPKIGNIASLEVRSDGLYATPEFTEEGQKLVDGGAYQYCSPGILWAGYVDEDGKEYSEVLDHLALSNRPFFGNRTSLFSSEESIMKETDAFAQFKEWFAELFKDLNLGKTSILPNEKVNVAAAIEPDNVPAQEKGKSNMAESTVITDTFDAKAKIDELTAQLGKQADEFKAAQEASLAEKKRADEFAAALTNERKIRRVSELHRVAESFAALPIQSDEFAEKFYALEQVNADLAKWFTEKFAQFNTDMAAGDLFSQISRRDARKAEVETVETFAAKIMAEETKQDKSKFSYTEALLEAAKRRPQLADKHLASSKSATE